MTEPTKPHPYDLFVNESKTPKWVATFDSDERREQYAEDVLEGKQVLKLITSIAMVGLLLGLIVLVYMFAIGNS